MPQSCKITTEGVFRLRDTTGEGLMACQRALVQCDGDNLLAEGWLRYAGCAVNVSGMTYEEWVMSRAKAYKARILSS